MTPIETIRRELDRASEAGRRVGIWWRDDDAVEATPALERLLALANRHEAPLAVAAIPAAVKAGLASRLGREPLVAILPHGLTHANHAAAGLKAAEFGPGREPEAVRGDLLQARRLTRDRFGPQALDLFVPPWNRFAPEHLPQLAATGYRGLSTFGRRQAAGMAGLAMLPTHLDPVAWRGSRGLAGADAIGHMVRDALGRDGTTMGLLSHHIAFDEALWGFFDDLLALLVSHPAARLHAVGELIGESERFPRAQRDLPADAALETAP